MLSSCLTCRHVVHVHILKTHIDIKQFYTVRPCLKTKYKGRGWGDCSAVKAFPQQARRAISRTNVNAVQEWQLASNFSLQTQNQGILRARLLGGLALLSELWEIVLVSESDTEASTHMIIHTNTYTCTRHIHKKMSQYGRIPNKFQIISNAKSGKKMKMLMRRHCCIILK